MPVNSSHHRRRLARAEANPLSFVPRPATPHDVAAMVSLQIAVWRTYWPTLTQPDADELTARYQQSLANPTHLVLVGNEPRKSDKTANPLIGFVVVMPNPAAAEMPEYPLLMTGPHSLPELSGHGIKQRLMAAGHAYGRQQGQGIVCWSLRSSLHFHQKCLDLKAHLVAYHLRNDQLPPDLPPQLPGNEHIAYGRHF